VGATFFRSARTPVWYRQCVRVLDAYLSWRRQNQIKHFDELSTPGTAAPSSVASSTAPPTPAPQTAVEKKTARLISMESSKTHNANRIAALSKAFKFTSRLEASNPEIEIDPEWLRNAQKKTRRTGRRTDRINNLAAEVTEEFEMVGAFDADRVQKEMERIS
jgi:hypothetical protein